jgi:hypothetical protein
MGVVFLSKLVLQVLRIILRFEGGSLNGVCNSTSVCGLEKACVMGSTGGKIMKRCIAGSNQCIGRGVLVMIFVDWTHELKG